MTKRILIDGMNLIYKFPDLTAFLMESQLGEARLGLLDCLWQIYQNKINVQVLVFFDGKKEPHSDCYSEDYEAMTERRTRY